MWLAVLGFLGGYLAPVLISTGSANHIGLFTYYAVLNAAVFAISWKQAWRLLNLIGFGFTFGVGAAWGATYYRPELFSTVEPFLVLFFLFYIVIGLLYVTKQTEHRRPWVDGTLVFGTPLVAFPLQAGMLKDDRFALAFSAIGVAAIAPSADSTSTGGASIMETLPPHFGQSCPSSSPVLISVPLPVHAHPSSPGLSSSCAKSAVLNSASRLSAQGPQMRPASSW